MKHLEWLDKIITLTLYTSRIMGGKEVSLNIVGYPESGKTEILMSYSENDGVIVLTDLTAYGIRRDIVPKIRDGKVKYIIIPDLLKIIGKNKAVSNDALTVINALIEEGYTASATYHEKFEGNKKPVKCGIITSITPDYMKVNKGIFSSTGFVSRFLCVGYKYSSTDIKDIMDYSFTTKASLDVKKKMLDLSSIKKEINIYPEKLDLTKIKDEVYKITAELSLAGTKLYGFRLSKMLAMLMRANAFMNDRTEVIQDDVEEIYGLMKHIYRG